jgi:hypothetical protein
VARKCLVQDVKIEKSFEQVETLADVSLSPTTDAFAVLIHFPPKKKSLFQQTIPRTRVARWFVFKPKFPNLGKFWRAFEWQMLVYFITIWNILWPFGLIYGRLA